MATGSISHQSNTVIVTKDSITIPAPSQGEITAEYVVDFSDDVPSGAIFLNAILKLSNQVYPMPYVTPTDGTLLTYYYKYNAGTRMLSIRNKTSEWTNYTIIATFLV